MNFVQRAAHLLRSAYARHKVLLFRSGYWIADTVRSVLFCFRSWLGRVRHSQRSLCIYLYRVKSSKSTSFFLHSVVVVLSLKDYRYRAADTATMGWLYTRVQAYQCANVPNVQSWSQACNRVRCLLSEQPKVTDLVFREGRHILCQLLRRYCGCYSDNSVDDDKISKGAFS